MSSIAEIGAFVLAAAFRKWLATNHQKPAGIWLQIFKKGSDVASITYAEALDEALCFGWIDGQKQAHDELSWVQKFTPRRARSGWSKINTQHADRLIDAGRMEPPGLAEVDAAKKDGRWHSAYDSPSNASFPEDFLTALGKDDKARGVLRIAQQSQPVRHFVPAANGEEAGNPAEAHGDDSRDVG